ncbi:MAG: uridine kinase [Proteobacteria bacterium]|nr:uridine kinase [Pseudomonadota bacterium]
MSFVIIIAGGTASGKTTIAKALALKLQAQVLTHDRYYKDIEIQEGHNFDEPDALDNKRIIQDIALLKNNHTASVPIYHFPTHKRLAEEELIKPTKYLIVEGILCLSVPEIAALSDLSVFVDTPDDIRLLRRVQRDVLDRGRSIESVFNQYLSTVRPMHHLHIEPAKSKASLIVDGTVPIAQNISVIFRNLP